MEESRKRKCDGEREVRRYTRVLWHLDIGEATLRDMLYSLAVNSFPDFDRQKIMDLGVGVDAEKAARCIHSHVTRATHTHAPVTASTLNTYDSNPLTCHMEQLGRPIKF